MPPAEAIQIGESCFSHAVEDGRRVYFSNLAPFDSHEVSDDRARLLRIARFAEHGVLRRDLVAAFGVNRSTVQRAVNQLRRQGRGRFCYAATAREAERLLASGQSGRAVARKLGIRPSTFSLNRRSGVIRGGRRAGPGRRRRQRRRSRRRRQCWSRRWSRRRSHRRRQRRSRGWSGANGTHATARRRWVGAPGTRRGDAGGNGTSDGDAAAVCGAAVGGCRRRRAGRKCPLRALRKAPPRDHGTRNSPRSRPAGTCLV